MKVDELLQELGGSDPIPALEKFNAYVEESSNAQGIINGLVLASDSCNEILNLLMTEKRTSSEVAAIFSTLSHVLINIASELREHISIGLHITRQLLHNHEAHIYRFLLPTNTNKNTKAVLRCITGMVLLGGEAANEVLVTLNWSQINISLIANRQSVKDVWDVRAWCIYMMLAFLNSTEEPHIIQQFLLKKDVLPAIFPGLIWDPCERVINVLKVMHESILLNPSISKTTKVHLFTPTTTKPLLDLYKWSGPMGKFTKSENIEELESEVANTVSNERVQIKKVLHKFMLTLCTSYKHGIVFREKEQKGQIQSNNWYVYNILSHMKTPWKISECSELMSRVLGVCPDLLKTYFPTLRTLLKPRPKKSFISIVDMISQTIACQAPWKKMETKGVSGVLACLVPNPLNQNLFKSLLESPYGQVRHCGMMLTLSILTKTKETCENIKQSHTLSVAVKEDTRRKVIASVFRALMPVSAIAHCWNIAAGIELVEQNFEEHLGDPDAAETVSVTSQLLSIAKTLTMYAELLPSQTVYKAIKPVEMLQNVRDYHDDEVGSSKVKFELQVLCLGFLADSKISQEYVVDTSLTEESLEHMEKNVLYQLIRTYAESKQHSSENGDATLMLSVTETCQSNLSSALAKTGLAAHYDGNIKFWLRHILKTNVVKLSSFLTRVIQKTVASLSQYTDMLVEIGSKATRDLNSSTIVETESVLTAIETLEIVDNEDVSQHAVSLPFSRLVFGALELLHSNPDPEYIDYFSSVMNDYLYSLSDPGVLVDILLKEESVTSSDLKAYLRCWVKKKYKQSKDNVQLSDGVGLSHIIRYLFMTHDWATVEKLLEGNKLLDVLDKADLDLVITQLLIYLCLQLNSEKTGMKELSPEKKGAKMVKKYTHLLRRLYESLSEDSDKKYAECVLQMVLEHPRILASYQPFCNKQSSVTELTQEFIDLALRKHSTFAPNTYPYFKTLVQNLQSPSSRRDGIDVYSPFAPFLSSKDTVISYEDLQNLFMICLEALCLHQPSHSTLIHEVIQLIQKTTSAKRVLSSQSAQFAIAKFLEFGSSAEKKNPQLEKIMYDFEKLLIQVMDSGKSEQLSPEDMKNLMQCQPPCAVLCCHLVKQHPPHARTLSRYFKKHQPSLPAQAPLLALLLDQEEGASAAGSAFAKLTETLRTWIITFEDEDDATRLLVPHALEKSILDVDFLGEVCQRLYKETVTAEKLPPKKILSLLPLFQKLADVEPDLSKFGLPGQHLALLQICLSCIKKTYKEKQENLKLLMELAKVTSEILPKLDGDSLRRTLSNSKLWSSFVKQVLRRGLGDVDVGPDLVNQLRDLCSVIYRKKRNSGGDKEEVLPATTLYSMIMGHTQYLSLMFNRDADWEKLKEAVVRLQLSVVECQPEVCQDAHVPVLLGAYTASMSTVDQCILMLLHRYEKEGHMSTLHPVLWGDVAVAHFGVGSQMPGFFREPTLEQILGLLDVTRLSLTCRSFDIWLPLSPLKFMQRISHYTMYVFCCR